MTKNESEEKNINIIEELKRELINKLILFNLSHAQISLIFLMLIQDLLCSETLKLLQFTEDTSFEEILDFLIERIKINIIEEFQYMKEKMN